MKRAVNLADTAEVRSFLEAFRDHALDAIAAGKDATPEAKKRMFSRHEARRRILEAEGAILALIEPAMVALPEPGAETPGEEGSAT
jgi:hypothetical protein